MTPEEQLRQALRAALVDGVLTQQDKARLQTLRQSLNIPAEVARRLVNEVRTELGTPTVPGATGNTLPLKEFTFEVVTVDPQGQVAERRSSQARSFDEELGEGLVLEMVQLPGGTFTMGSPESEPERTEAEGPQHEVTVAPIFIGKYPITQMQWRAVYTLPQVKRPLLPAPSRFKSASCPVESISWHDAMEFCARLARMTGRSYRLPSEAEWEYACRAGITTAFHFGETITTELENHSGIRPYGMAPKGRHLGQTTQVGAFLVANVFGLYDLHGNVWEWCADPWHDNYQGAPADGRIWDDGGDLTRRVSRGGSWGSVARCCRSAYRHGLRPESVAEFQGFRVALSYGSHEH